MRRRACLFRALSDVPERPDVVRSPGDIVAKVFFGWRTKILRAADAFRTRRREGATSFYTKTTTDLRIGLANVAAVDI